MKRNIRNFILIRWYLIIIGALSLIILGLIVICGWYFALPTLIQIYPDFVPMQFNTALGFVLIGLALICLNYSYYLASKILGLLVLLLGGITLIQYWFDLNLGLDELLMKHYIVTATSHPGRMAPNTAFNFSLTGLAIALISWKKPKLKQLFQSSILGSLIIGLATVAFLGYITKIETAYGWGKLTQMALHTSIGFIIVGSLLILQVLHFSLQIYRKIPPLWPTMTIGILGVTVTIAFWQALNANELRIATQYGIITSSLINEAILAFGLAFSLLLAVTVWLTLRYYRQIQHLKKAQRKIIKLNQELEKLSYLDGLTGIANRRMFDITLEKEIHRSDRENQSVALILLDIDYFKNYNDYYGHQQGDECLKQVANEIKKMGRRATDLAARYGGEEFALLLPSADLENAQAIAQSILDKISQLEIPHQASQISQFITLSVGVGVYQQQQEITPEKFVFLVDQALYQAKNQGRSRIVLMNLTN
jgi:diguanylate cyclase (GGDEF)-like protein